MITLRALLLTALTAWLMTSTANSMAQESTRSDTDSVADAVYLLSPLGPQDAQQIAALPQSHWRKLSDGKTPAQLGMRAANVWIKLQLPRTENDTLWISVANASLEHFSAFSASNSLVTPLDVRPILSAQGFPSLPIRILNNTPQTVLLCLQSRDQLSLSLRVHSSNSLLETNAQNKLLEWLVVGAALGVTLLSASSQWRAKTAAFAWLAGWLLANVLAYSGKHQLLGAGLLNTSFTLLAQSATLLIAAALLREVYQSKNRHPRLHLGFNLYLLSTAVVLLPLAAAGNIPLFKFLYLACFGFLIAVALVTASVNRERDFPGATAFAISILMAATIPTALQFVSYHWLWAAEQRDLLLLLTALLSGAIMLKGLDTQSTNLSPTNNPVSLQQARQEALASTQQQLLARISLNLHPALEGFFSLISRLAKARIPVEQARTALHIERSAARLQVTLENLEDMARMRRDLLHTNRLDFCLDIVLSDVLQTLLSRARATGLTIGVDIAPEIPMLLSGDEPRLRRMLIGLLDHAMHRAYRGHLLLRVERVPATEAGPLRLCFTLDDSSIHTLAPETAQELSPAEGSQPIFSDINLEGCRALARHLGGDLQISTHKGSGRSYSLTLAFEFCQQTLQVALPAVRQQTLLLVDTDSADRIALTDEARDWGMDVLYAADMSQGIELLDGRTAPDVIAFNPRLPEASQWLSSTLLAELDSLPKEGLLVLSAKDLSALRAGEELAGALYFAKPVRSMVFGQLISELIALNTERENIVRHRPLTVVVDDNPVNARLLKQQLERLGFRPHFCVDAQEALDYAEQHWQSIAALIIDSELPRLGGTEMPRALRLMAARRADAPLPLLSMTSQQDSDTISALQAAGAMAVLSKPVSSVALARELGRALLSAQN